MLLPLLQLPFSGVWTGLMRMLQHVACKACTFLRWRCSTMQSCSLYFWHLLLGNQLHGTELPLLIGFVCKELQVHAYCLDLHLRCMLCVKHCVVMHSQRPCLCTRLFLLFHSAHQDHFFLLNSVSSCHARRSCSNSLLTTLDADHVVVDRQFCGGTGCLAQPTQVPLEFCQNVVNM